jgi:APA family basic amino acid/polyamine antiporter
MPPKNASKPKFKRVLDLFSATLISIGAIIGSGIFFIIGMAASESGPALVLSMALAGLIAVLTALSFASLGSKIVKEGGEYQFIYIAFGKTVGFFAGIFWIFATAISGVAVSLAFGSYLSALFPILNINLIAAAAIIAFMSIDIVGLRFTSSVNNVLTIIKVSVLITFILVCILHFNLSNFGNFFQKGAGGLLSSTFLIFFAYAGFGKITAAGEEVKNPKKTIPRAIILAVSICTLLYILAGLVAVGFVGAGELGSKAFRNAPFANVMLATGFAPAFFFVVLGALTATASVLLIQIFGVSRTILAMSSNRQLPSFLSELHRRFRTPYKAQIILGAGMAAMALFMNAGSMIRITSFGILGYYSLINLAALVMKSKKKGGFEVNRIIPIIGFISSMLLIFYYIVQLIFR